jgi:uncharacterized protein YhfF
MPRYSPALRCLSGMVFLPSRLACSNTRSTIPPSRKHDFWQHELHEYSRGPAARKPDHAALRSFGTCRHKCLAVSRRLVRLGVVSREDLPIADFAFPGPLRDQLVAAILSGGKTTTSGLVADYEHEGEPLPRPGLRQAVVDSAGNRVAVIETTAVRVVRLGDVDLAHAAGEGEGYSSVAEWRAGHERFWHSAEMRRALDDPQFTVNDGTLVVAQAFRLER